MPLNKPTIVIAGAGEVGYHLIENLHREVPDLLVIDSDGDVLERIAAAFEVRTEEANVIESRHMNRSYLKGVDLFLAITNSDETNMIACKTASEAGVGKTICRIRQIDFSTSERSFSLDALGIDQVINPVSLVAERIYQLVQSPDVVDRHEFLSGDIYLTGFKIRQSCRIADKTAGDLEEDLAERLFRIAVVQHTDMAVVPSRTTAIRPNDVVYFFCRADKFGELKAYLGYAKTNVAERRIFINGGGHIGVRLAERLEQAGQRVKVIEKDLSRSFHISERLTKSLVLNFDGTDLKQLTAEGIENADFFISVTNDEKINLSSCLLAAEQGVKRTICLVHQPEFISIVEQNTPISLGISPRVLTTKYLARFIQRSDVRSYFPLSNSQLAILELELDDLTPCLGLPLKDLQFPQNVVVGLIKREGDILLPDGEHELRSGDVILIIVHRLDKTKVMEFFQPLAF